LSFLSTSSLCVAASVLKAHLIVSPVADLTAVYVVKGGHICFRLEAIIIANITACTLNGIAGCRVNFLGVKPAFQIGIAQFSMFMGAN